MFDHKGFLEKFGKKIPQDAKIYFYMDEKMKAGQIYF